MQDVCELRSHQYSIFTLFTFNYYAAPLQAVEKAKNKREWDSGVKSMLYLLFEVVRALSATWLMLTFFSFLFCSLRSFFFAQSSQMLHGQCICFCTPYFLLPFTGLLEIIPVKFLLLLSLFVKKSGKFQIAFEIALFQFFFEMLLDRCLVRKMPLMPSITK